MCTHVRKLNLFENIRQILTKNIKELKLDDFLGLRSNLQKGIELGWPMY